jgi:hypothetical protein
MAREGLRTDPHGMHTSATLGFELPLLLGLDFRDSPEIAMMFEPV